MLNNEELDSVVSMNFLQSQFWAEFKTRPGVSQFFVDFSAEVTHNKPVSVSVFLHTLFASFTLAYIPHGPAINCLPEERYQLLLDLAREIKKHLPPGCLALRFDPAWYHIGSSDVVDPAMVMRPRFMSPLVKAADVQPPDTVVLPIAATEEALLAGMKPKWRYNIKLAAKKNVEVAVESWYVKPDNAVDGSDSVQRQEKNRHAIDTFYKLYQATAQRDKISLHSKSYYQLLLELSTSKIASGMAQARDKTAKPIPDVRVWVARHETEALASIITMFYGDQAVYLYGASADNKRNLMPAYLLQWEAIKAAKTTGCRTYDFYGIPPVEDPDHPMAGLYRFKTGFGGQLRHYAGCWDIPFKPVLYRLYRLAERLRLLWHKKLKKQR